MKVSIIGGGGRVGSNTAYALQCYGVVSEIAIVDVNEELAGGEALDLLHGASIAGDQRIYSCGIGDVGDSDVVCIAAGARRKPEETRLDLINRNVSIFRGILDELKAGGLRSNAILFVVSNPVDILTRMAVEHLGWESSRVIGLGTVLDTARFRSLIAEAKGYPATQVKALILGEHGDSMLPVWSSATMGGVSLGNLLTTHEQNQLFERAKTSGAEVLRGKGGAGYAVGLSIAEVIHSIALDRRQVLPVSTKLGGQYGLRDVCLSLPTVVGRDGAVDYVTPELWPKEVGALSASARALNETWGKVV